MFGLPLTRKPHYSRSKFSEPRLNPRTDWRKTFTPLAIELYRRQSMSPRAPDGSTAFCGSKRMQAIRIAAMTSDAIGLLSSDPPCFNGLSRKSPKVAPSGRVRMTPSRTEGPAIHRSKSKAQP